MKFFDLHKQSGQAIIYVILLGASVLGAALVANQNILVDILRTKRLEEANIAYYKAEGAMEEALLDLKNGTLKEGDKYAPASTTKVTEISSEELLPNSDPPGVLKKDQSLTLDIPTEWKGKDVQLVFDPNNGLKEKDDAGNFYEINPDNRRLEIRFFDDQNQIHMGKFYTAKQISDLNYVPKYLSPSNAKTLQLKPYGMDVKFAIKADGTSFINTSKKTIHTEGIFGNSSREINIELDQQNLMPLPIFDFGLFSQGTTDLIK